MSVDEVKSWVDSAKDEEILFIEAYLHHRRRAGSDADRARLSRIRDRSQFYSSEQIKELDEQLRQQGL